MPLVDLFQAPKLETFLVRAVCILVTCQLHVLYPSVAVSSYIDGDFVIYRENLIFFTEKNQIFCPIVLPTSYVCISARYNCLPISN